MERKLCPFMTLTIERVDSMGGNRVQIIGKTECKALKETRNCLVDCRGKVSDAFDKYYCCASFGC